MGRVGVGVGVGDMTKAVYDPDEDGKLALAQLVDAEGGEWCTLSGLLSQP